MKNNIISFSKKCILKIGFIAVLFLVSMLSSCELVRSVNDIFISDHEPAQITFKISNYKGESLSYTLKSETGLLESGEISNIDANGQFKTKEIYEVGFAKYYEIVITGINGSDCFCTYQFEFTAGLADSFVEIELEKKINFDEAFAYLKNETVKVSGYDDDEYQEILYFGTKAFDFTNRVHDLWTCMEEIGPGASRQVWYRLCYDVDPAKIEKINGNTAKITLDLHSAYFGSGNSGDTIQSSMGISGYPQQMILTINFNNYENYLKVNRNDPKTGDYVDEKWVIMKD